MSQDIAELAEVSRGHSTKKKWEGLNIIARVGRGKFDAKAKKAENLGRDLAWQRCGEYAKM